MIHKALNIMLTSNKERQLIVNTSLNGYVIYRYTIDIQKGNKITGVWKGIASNDNSRYAD